MKYPAYPQYKDSGVAWLGEVPEDWGVWKLSQGFDQTGSGTTPPSDNEDWYDGETPWVTTSELRETVITDTTKKVSQTAIQTFSALKIFPQGSLAIAMYGATIGRLGIFGVPATTNQACCVMFGEKALAIRFVFYWFQAFREQIILLASGGGQPNISQEKIRSIRIACPIISDQTAIADFLDRETGRIDTLVAKKRKLVELLKEKRSALISRTVTRGLPANAAREFGLTTGDTPVSEASANYGRGDFNRPQTEANKFAPKDEHASPQTFKDSGVEWLGEVPAHWEIKKRGIWHI